MALLRRDALSIPTRLFLSAAFWSTLLLLIAGIGLVTVFRSTTEQAFDDRLSVYLRALVADVALSGDDTSNSPGQQLGEPLFELTRSGWYWQVTRVDGPNPQIRASKSLFATRLPKLADIGVRPDQTGLRKGFVEGPDGRNLRMIERVIDVGDDGTFLVQVAETNEDVEAQIRRFTLTLALTFAILALALVGTTALQVRFGLRPLRGLQGEVSAIRRGEGEKIAGAYPRDLSPLASELNLLIASNREVIERARTQVGNLAHALKTPLSVIANEAEADASPLSAKIREQTDVMRDQVTFYLDRARLAARSSVIGTITEVEPVLDALMRTFEKVHARVDFDFDGAAGLRFRGERHDLEEMAGNLIDNAGKWAKSRVEVRARVADEGYFDVIVEDDGPGLPPERRQEAVKRGQRLDETKPGSGLGLSIVHDLALVYGGLLTLDDAPSGGLRAILRLPSA
jgi:signal transduction histidine kinase